MVEIKGANSDRSLKPDNMSYTVLFSKPEEFF
jgi:hypothetical protein